MATFAKKIATAKHIFDSDGFGGLAATLRHKLTEPILNYWGQDHWWAGRLVELTGNRVHIDGCRFSVNSFAIKTEIKSRFLLGTYEEAERNAIRRFLDPSLPVVEFGASVGVIACLTNHMLKDPRRHVVVEANPALLPLLKANCERNDCRFTVLHSAVAYGSDEVLFYQNEEDYLASSVQLPSHKPVCIPTINLKQVLDRFAFEHCTLVCDIEGGERDVIFRETAVLRDRVAMIIVEVHEKVLGAEVVHALFSTLQEIGFHALYAERETYVFQKV